MKRPVLTLLATALAAAGSLVGGSVSPVEAGGFQLRVLGAPAGGIGIDGGGAAYNPCQLGWSGNGTVTGSVPGGGALRFELYPGGCADKYDPWGNIGGVHFDATPAQAQNAGNIQLPVMGDPGVFKITGDILSGSPITTGRVVVDTFQITTGYPEPAAPLQNNGRVAYGAFASTASRGSQWTGGAGWAGRYLFFVTDTATGRKITAAADVAPGSIPTIDLDAICFGFDTCTYGAGGPSTTSGSFHPTAPTRILDTRRGLGIWGPIKSGDGRNSSLDPITRRDETANHDLQITGKYGVPASGVSAVLLNVTAVSAGAPGPGFMSVVPKPPRVGDIFNDQATYGAMPATSNLNIDDGNPVPNLVLARVGAGGKIRITNFLGPTHTIADIAGWFGTDGAYTDGAGFAGVVPARLLDTRTGIGGAVSRFAPGEARTVQVAGVAGVPRNAQSVVVNITMTGSDASGFVTAYPDGQAAPDASNVNIVPGGVRANTAVVQVGAGGRIALLVSETSADVIVDVLGSFGAYGGRVTTITPERILDSRGGVGTTAAPWGEGETRTVVVAGRGSVPATATAVIANLTATNTTAWGYLSAWPTGAPQPTSSNLNFLPGQNVPNLVMLKLGDGGSLSIQNGRGSAHVILDVMGYVN